MKPKGKLAFVLGAHVWILGGNRWDSQFDIRFSTPGNLTSKI